MSSFIKPFKLEKKKASVDLAAISNFVLVCG